MMRASFRILAAVLLYLLAGPSFAQNSQPAPASPSGQGVLTGPQLEALVSPIALYPDALLSEILMASTYPLEVVAADRWIKGNANLQGDQLKTAVDQQSWDQSVKSLAATPDVLDMMSTKLDWTQKLGDAVLAQQPEVMDAIQRLRQRAQSRGKLMNTAQQTVRTQVQGGKQVIAIEPTEPDTVYVPYYDPAVVYGEWPYPDYPPYYFGYPGWIGPAIIGTGLAFGGAYALGRWALNGNRWGGGLNWGKNQINPLRSVNNINGGNNWVHNPAHRQGLRYSNANVAQRFGGNRNNAAANRGNFRGSNGQQVLNPSGNRGGGAAGGRPGNGNAAGGKRPGTGNASAGNRPAHHASNRSAHNGGNRTANRASANRAASKHTNTGNRASAHRSASNRSVANAGARHTPSRGAGTPGRGAFASAGGARMGGMRPGGGGGFRGGGGRGGGRRSDLRLKHDIVELGHLANGIGLYRFVYNGGHTAYVGVIAQEVQSVLPAAVTHGADGYLRVRYDKLGLKFQTYRKWLQNREQESPTAPSAP